MVGITYYRTTQEGGMRGALFTRESGVSEAADGGSAMRWREPTGSLCVRHQRGGISSKDTMHDARDLDAVRDLAVQEEVPSHRKVAQARRNVGPCGPRGGPLRERQGLLPDVPK